MATATDFEKCRILQASTAAGAHEGSGVAHQMIRALLHGLCQLSPGGSAGRFVDGGDVLHQSELPNAAACWSAFISNSQRDSARQTLRRLAHSRTTATTGSQRISKLQWTVALCFSRL
jgi:hypothetical protein